MEKNGLEILKGNVVDADGLSILGPINPRVNIPLGGKRARADGPDETTISLGDRLAAFACNHNESVDIFVANEPLAAASTHKSGCAKLVVSAVRGNHQIDTENPLVMLASSSGADVGEINLGPPYAAGERTLIEVNSNTGQPVSYQFVRVGPDGSVKISTPGYFATG